MIPVGVTPSIYVGGPPILPSETRETWTRLAPVEVYKGTPGVQRLNGLEHVKSGWNARANGEWPYWLVAQAAKGYPGLQRNASAASTGTYPAYSAHLAREHLAAKLGAPGQWASAYSSGG